MEPAPHAGRGAIHVASPGAGRFHAVLWHRFGAASDRLKDGLDSLSTLTTFVKKRIDAERDIAKILFQMTKGSSWSPFGGAPKELQETVKETGRVLEAWEVMMRKTTETCTPSPRCPAASLPLLFGPTRALG
jgi:hypothetical protein